MSAATKRSPAAVLAMLGLADIAFAFQQTAVIPAIPTVKHDLHVGPTWSLWLVSGYLVASSVATPLLGKLADRHGKRRLLSLALGLFFLGSIGAALSPSIAPLIAFRAVQGAGGAVFPLSLSLAREQLPEDRVGVGIGLLTGAFGVGTTLGFAISGAIVEMASWRWVFAAGAIAVLAAMVLVPVAIPRSDIRNQRDLDLPGATLLTGGISLLLVGITEGAPLGWGAWEVVGALAVGLALLAAWVWREVRTSDPLIDLSVLSSRPVLLTNLASLLLGYALFAVYVLVPLLVSSRHHAGYGFGAGPLVTGLYLVPAAVGQLVAGSLSGYLAERTASKWVFTAGMALTAAGPAVLAGLHDRSWEIVLGTLLLGLGNGLAIGVASAVITETAPGEETGIATALNSVLRRVGGGFGSQISAAVLAAVVLAGGAPSQTAFEIAFAICAGMALAGTGLTAGIG